MTAPTTTTWPGPAPVRPAIARPQALGLALVEYARMADAVDALTGADWEAPTDCTDWTVRDLVAHVAGMAAFVTTPVEMMRQMRAASTRRVPGQALVDVQTALQVSERATLSNVQLQAQVRTVGPAAARGRRRIPSIVRSRRIPEPQCVDGAPETWTLGYLLDVILTRDTWMHRLDLARATSGTPVLTPEHDGVIVADVVAEWARRHAQPFTLDLTGAAGGHWSAGTDGPAITMDAADFCRALSGRPLPDNRARSVLLAVSVPF